MTTHRIKSEKFGRLPSLLSFSLAALLRFYKGEERDGEFYGKGEKEYLIRDDKDVCRYFANLPWADTALAVSGAHIVLFTTGRGTPFGCPVPTVKISTNTALYDKKRAWIDFDAGVLYHYYRCFLKKYLTFSQKDSLFLVKTLEIS